MQTNRAFSGCACHGMGRRDFLAAGCAACAGWAGLGALSRAEASDATTARSVAQVRIVFALHGIVQPKPTWPNIGFDFAPVMANIAIALKQGCPDIEFVTSTAAGAEEAAAILKQDEGADITGYLVYQMNNWNPVAPTFVASGKPVLFADFTYGGSGGFLVQTARFLREPASNAGFVASSNLDDVVAAARCFQSAKQDGPGCFAAVTAEVRRRRTPQPSRSSCIADTFKTASIGDVLHRLEESKILAVHDQDTGPAEPFMRIPVEKVAFAEINAAWSAANRDEAHAIAARWHETAAAVTEVSDETLEASAAMYLGMQSVLKAHGANAITINCLGGFYGGHLQAYPCLGFHELNNQGLVGGCECDIRSAGSMLVVNALTQGRPGYISDPVIDTAKGQIIYAHCVASNRPFGPDGAVNPFQILTHSEDRKGAAIRSLLPVGYMTTTIQIDAGKKQILFHQGTAVSNDPNDRACRTKLGVEPAGDIEKLFRMWDQWGWHRVTAYGDLKAALAELAGAIHYEAVSEA